MKKIIRVVTLLTLLSSVTLCGWASTPIAVVEAISPPILCNGENTGSIGIMPSGGTAPYTYHWSNGATTQNINGLIAGTYTITVTDNTGATSTFAFTVSQPAAIVIAKSVVNENCGGQDIGSVTLTVSGGTTPYSYIWSNGATTQNISNLTAAVYYVTLTDANGCMDIDSANVTQPPGIGITDTIKDVTCSAGMNDGAINVGVQFGNAPYQYAWNDGITTEDRSNLVPGTYSITVTDAIGCTATATADVTQQPGTMSINTNSTSPTCFGGSNGTAGVTSVVGSTSPYTYLWSNSGTAQNITGLGSGTYVVTATSSTGCSASASVLLTQPVQIDITLHAFPLTCYESNNGAINSTVSLGVSPYSYSWSNGQVTPDINSLAAGTYVLTVTDAHGCTAVANAALVSQPLIIDATATPSPLACSGGPTGSVITSVSGGTSPYSYWWGAGVISADRIDVNSGTYDVTVTDAHGCTATTTATVAPYTPMSLVSSQTDVVCYGNANGSLDIVPVNGIGPYTYIWSNGDTTADIDSLAGGTYDVTVTDAHACSVTGGSTIVAPPFPITVNSTATDVTCFGLSNGTLTLDPINGAPPYNYKWGNGSTSAEITNLAVGSYVVTITDSVGCKASGVYSVTQPALITPVTTVTNVSCFGTNTGAIELSVTGGYSPFTYSWNNGTDSQSRSSLYAGFYTVTVTDNHGCTMNAGATVSQPTQLTLSTTKVNPTCFGGTNGSITVTATGGTSPYTYSWTGGILTPEFTGGAGTYTVTVTDNKGCTSHASATLTAPNAIHIFSSTTSVACNGGASGGITLSVNGGTFPYSFVWNDSNTEEDRDSLTSGNYTVTVTDNAGCTAASTIAISEATNLTIVPAITNVTCFGMSNGSVAVTPGGGTSPYTYSWNNGVTLPERTNLTAGSYAITVTDNAGCSVSIAPTVSQPTLMSVSSTTTEPACFGAANGDIHITVSGGTVPYSYNWGAGITTQNRTNIAAGNYSVTVTDSAGCTVANASTLGQPVALNVVSNPTNVSCNGGSNGSILLTVNGGTSPYSFSWTGGVTTQNRAGLTAGSYDVTVTDANGCSVTRAISITQPNMLTAVTNVTNVACFNQSSGAVALTVNGGTGPFTYSWSNGDFSQNIVGLNAGNYAVTVTDANLCSASVSAAVTQPVILTTSVFSVVDASCFGESNGVVTIQISGGTPAYTYSWSNGATTQNLNGVGVGTYQVTAADANGCTASTIMHVTQPNQITITSAVTNALCYNSNTGAITITVAGGNGGFTYSWSNGATTANLTGLVAGAYTVTVKDVMNCSASLTTQVNQSSQMVLTTTETGVTCNGANTGTASVATTGGAGGYIYSWSNGQTTAQINQLGQGNITVTVTDANACTASTSVNIAQSNSLVLNLTTVDVTCFGLANGSVTSSISGGAGGYQYNWNNSATTNNITGLAAGNYELTVTDANQCSTSALANVTQGTAITATPTVTNVACFGSATGAIEIASAGGAGGYQYAWSNGASSQNLTGVDAGSYSVTVKDANACSVSSSMIVTQPVQLNINLNATNESCNGGSNGAITSVVVGGTGVYTYSWSNTSTASNINNLQAGTYIVTVKDAMSCSMTSSINIMQPQAIVLHATGTNVICNGGNNGAVSLQVSGGTGAYTFNWSNQATTQQINQLIAGNYVVTVEDANLCSVTASANITQPAPVDVTTTQANYACANKAGVIDIAVSGGTSPYTYSWQDGNTAQNRTGLQAGNYAVTVTDQNHCTQTASVTISQIPALTASITSTNVNCFGGSTGTMSVAVTGGSQPYNYNWSNAGNTGNIQNLTANTYSVVVTDADGCTVSSVGSISQAPAIQLSSTTTPVTCNGLSDGSASVVASGGTSPFSYQWSNNSSGAIITSVAAGTYAVTVTDGNHCTAVFNNVSVTQPALLSIASTVVPLGCTAQNDGAINVAAGGGTPPYQYNWSTSAKSADIDSLAAGTYGVTIYDNNNCAISENFAVAPSTPLSVTPTVQNATCVGINNGSVSVAVNGGTLPYTYDWNNGQHTETANGLANGAYTVTIIDANGCSIESGGDVAGGYDLTVHASASATFTTGTPVQLAATTNVDHQNSYSWTPVVNILTCSTCSNTEANPQQTTLFTVSVVDINGCKATDTITIDVNLSTEIFIPNAFTPNGDGVNDQFKIFGDLSNVYFIDMAIFDRWGEKVFESTNPNFEWDGTYKGEPAPLGVYIYTATIAFGDGSHKDYKGSVTLLR